MKCFLDRVIEIYSLIQHLFVGDKPHSVVNRQESMGTDDDFVRSLKALSRISNCELSLSAFKANITGQIYNGISNRVCNIDVNVIS